MRKLAQGLTLGAAMTIAATGVASAQTPGSRTVIAPATVLALNAHGQVIHAARAKSTIQFAIRFALPASFPSGYTDIRFEILIHKHVERSIIYGTPKHVHPRDTVHLSVTSTVSKLWLGTITVRGTIRLLAKPGGSALGYEGQGSTPLTVTR